MGGVLAVSVCRSDDGTLFPAACLCLGTSPGWAFVQAGGKFLLIVLGDQGGVTPVSTSERRLWPVVFHPEESGTCSILGGRLHPDQPAVGTHSRLRFWSFPGSWDYTDEFSKLNFGQRGYGLKMKMNLKRRLQLILESENAGVVDIIMAMPSCRESIWWGRRTRSIW